MPFDLADVLTHLSDPKAPLEPGLYLVATPIGNLGDISLRALEILQGATRILCEDTRVTQKLLNAYGIQTPTTSYHDFSSEKKHERIIDELRGGTQAFALVSDAGMPLMSDPGYQLVVAAKEAGVPVWCIPGASAILTALVSSGLPPYPFYFGGFLPAAEGARRTTLTAVQNIPASLVFFETFPRMEATLQTLGAVFGPHRRVAFCRELTKKFEEIQMAPLGEWLSHTVHFSKDKGELVLVIEGAKPTEVLPETEVVALLQNTQKRGLRVKEAAAELQEITGWRRQDLYRLALKTYGDAAGMDDH